MAQVLVKVAIVYVNRRYSLKKMQTNSYAQLQIRKSRQLVRISFDILLEFNHLFGLLRPPVSALYVLVEQSFILMEFPTSGTT